MKNKTLIIAAHPDDEILGCGGYISKYSHLEDIYVLIVTDGSSSQYNDNKYISIKKEQAEKIKNISGIKEYIWLNLPDMKLDTLVHIDLNIAIGKVINKLKPSKIFTHHWGDVNMDHKKIFESTIVCTRPNDFIKEIVCYEVPSGTEWDSRDISIFNPNIYELLNKNDVEKKIHFLSLYDTEIRNYPHPRSLKAMEIYASFRGISINTEFAEAYFLYRQIK